MKWGKTKKEQSWEEKRFAYLPVELSDGTIIWWEHYWVRMRSFYGILSNSWMVLEKERWQKDTTFKGNK